MRRLLVLLVLAGCAGKAGPDPRAGALCTLDTSVGASEPLVRRTLPAGYWFALMVYGYRPNGEIVRPARDCERQPVVFPADACRSDAPGEPLPDALLSEEDLVVVNLDGGQRLVWAMVERLPSGEAQGPVALAELDGRGVAVKRLGVLRAYPGRPRLRLEKTTTGTVLVAEGETCADPQDPKTCLRAVRILPMAGNRFVPVDVTDAGGRCLGAAFFPLRLEGAEGQGARARRYELQTAVTYGPDGIDVAEQLSIVEPPPVGATAGFTRRSEQKRLITVQAGRLITENPSLLERWRRTAAR